jgi:hypothetical protein
VARDSQNEPMATADSWRGFQDRVWAVYVEARRAQAAQFAASVEPVIREVQAAGHTSCNAIVELLNARKVATADWGRRTYEQCARVRSCARSPLIATPPGAADHVWVEGPTTRAACGQKSAGEEDFRLFRIPGLRPY